jgi:hypothetical protein
MVVTPWYLLHLNRRRKKSIEDFKKLREQRNDQFWDDDGSYVKDKIDEILRGR